MMKQKEFWMLLLLAACLKSIGQTTFFFDGLQAVADSVDHHLYATVDRELAYITSDRDGLLEWDGDTVTQDTGIPLDYSKHVHTLRHLRDFQDTIAWNYIHMIESMDFLSDILPTYMPGNPPLNINEAYDIEGRKVPFQSWPNMYIYQGKKYIRRAK